jgi:hypothetical protein
MVTPAFLADIDTLIVITLSRRRRGVTSVVSLDAIVALPFSEGGEWNSR